MSSRVSLCESLSDTDSHAASRSRVGDGSRRELEHDMEISTLYDSSQAGAVRTPSVSSGTETPLGRPGAAGTKCRSFGDGDGDTRSPDDQNRHVSVSHGVNTNTGRSILDAEPPFGRPGDAGAKCQDAVQSRRLRSFNDGGGDTSSHVRAHNALARCGETKLTSTGRTVRGGGDAGRVKYGPVFRNAKTATQLGRPAANPRQRPHSIDNGGERVTHGGAASS